MTAEGYENRIACVEWHAEWWRRSGVDYAICDRMMRHCTECVEANFYGEPRPSAARFISATEYPSAGYWARKMQVYFDNLFASTNNVVSYD